MFTKSLLELLPFAPTPQVAAAVSAAGMASSVLDWAAGLKKTEEEGQFVLQELELIGAQNELLSLLNKQIDRINYTSSLNMAKRAANLNSISFARIGINPTTGTPLNMYTSTYQTVLTQALRRNLVETNG